MTDDEHYDREPEEPPSSVLRPRLAAGDLTGVPSLDDLGLRDAKEVAFAWQTHRGHAEWHEMVWVMESRTRSEWLGEIHGLFGIVGELVLVAIEVESEKYMLRVTLRDEQSLPVQAGLWRALRFFAEGQANELVVAGHVVGNLTLRTMALHRDFDANKLPKGIDIRGTKFTPRSDDRGAWVSLNKATAKDLVRVATKLQLPELVALGESLRELTAKGNPWRELNNMRGEQYHRWRGESHGVTGVNFNAPTMVGRLLGGQAVGIGGPHPEYTEGQGVVEEVSDRSRKALDSFAAWMPGFLEIWLSAFGALRSNGP